MSEQNENIRPKVMESITESQLEELQLQFDDNDRNEFARIAGTYGWSNDDIDQVWNFLKAGDLQKHPHDIP